jgi:16S rRNA (adenine(1408)-N(1))-methyltransferase
MKGVVIDIGTGDGLFVYQHARQNPDRLYIGIDADPSQLAATARKTRRKPKKGGVPNALFIQAAVEALPPELDAVADEVHIHFPWGGLLRAVVNGEAEVLHSLRRLCAPGALLEVVIGLDPQQDRSVIEALDLKSLTPETWRERLKSRYEANGFEVLEMGVLAPAAWPDFRTSWAKRLRRSAGRSLTYLVGQAVGPAPVRDAADAPSDGAVPCAGPPPALVARRRGA